MTRIEIYDQMREIERRDLDLFGCWGRSSLFVSHTAPSWDNALSFRTRALVCFAPGYVTYLMSNQILALLAIAPQMSMFWLCLSTAIADLKLLINQSYCLWTSTCVNANQSFLIGLSMQGSLTGAVL
jgi:hypothetical protein